MNDLLRRKLKQLPDSPGCYLMKDNGGKIIYVGKAVNLKNRVRSYFNGKHDPRVFSCLPCLAGWQTVG